MKHKKTIIVLMTGIALALVAYAAVYATGDHYQGCRGHERLSYLKDAKFDVTNTQDGVTITISTEDPEAVDRIQEHFANFGKEGAMHGHAEGSEHSETGESHHNE